MSESLRPSGDADYDEACAEEARGNLPTTGRIEIHDEAIEAAARAIFHRGGHYGKTWESHAHPDQKKDLRQYAEVILDASGLPARVKELEADVADMEDESKGLRERLAECWRERDVAIEALRYYADPENWSEDDWNIRAVTTEYADAGATARKALASVGRDTDE